MPLLDHPLRLRDRPAFDDGDRSLRIVDLFAGCGGITLGLAQAARAAGYAIDIPLAVDFEPLATSIYHQNFPFAERVETASVESFFDGELAAAETIAEKRTIGSVGSVDVLVGGPPCQGHSSLNNRTRRVDPKNGLYLRMARAAEVLRPAVVLIENVPAVVRDRHDGVGVVERTVAHLRSLDYRIEQRVIALADLGVAQTRRRHVLLATARDQPEPSAILDSLGANQEARDLRWAIGDLVAIERPDLLDRAPQASPENLDRMRFLLDNDEYDLPNHLRPECHRGDHTYKSMYGRLRWGEPAQTVTSGYGSIGQGRYMHPELPRALTAHEAARIQGFPDYFDFSGCPTRSALATMIGNAVPPQLGAALLSTVLGLGGLSAATAASEPRSA